MTSPRCTSVSHVLSRSGHVPSMASGAWSGQCTSGSGGLPSNLIS